MKFKKALSISLIASVLALVTTTASAKDSYIIACDAAYAPFSWEENGKYRGIDVEVLEAVAKVSDFEYELKPMNFDAVVPGLISGQLDGAIAGINMNDERRRIMDFSEGYFDSGLSVIVRKDSPVASVDDLKGLKAAVKKGTTGAVFVEDNEDKYDFDIAYYTSSPETMLAVKNSNADFLLEDYPVIAYQIKIGVQDGLKIAVPRVAGTPQYGFAVKKGSQKELLKKFNDGLKKIKEDGTYQKIVSQYL